MSKFKKTFTRLSATLPLALSSAFPVGIGGSALLALSSCEGGAEEAGEDIDEALEDAGEAIEDATDNK